MTDIREILKERGNNYGEFPGHALLAQQLKQSVSSHKGYEALSFTMKEALDMVCHKMARIVNGNPYYLDSWVDIIGYVQLVIDEIKKWEYEQEKKNKIGNESYVQLEAGDLLERLKREDAKRNRK